MSEAKSTEPTRIVVVLAQYPPSELERRQTAVRRSAPSNVEIDFRQITGNVYRKGLTELHRALVAPLVAEQAHRAQEDGYDAVVPYGTLDLGVEEARHVVDIPVLGPGRTAALTAATLAQRFVVICYDEPHVTMFTRLLPMWDVAQHVTSIRPVDVPVTEMTSNVELLRERFVTVARRAADEERAQLILPLGMTMVPVNLSAAELTAEIGLPVLDPIAVTLRLADALAATGYVNSRAAYPAASLG